MIIVRLLITSGLLVIFTLLLYPKFILAILLLPLVFLVPAKNREKTKNKVDELVGICQNAIENSGKKLANKNKILKLLEERGDLSNSEVSEALGVSKRSIVRYMNELEKEGKVEQMGETGRNVTYRRLTKG